jgi:hypothetical protein
MTTPAFLPMLWRGMHPVARTAGRHSDAALHALLCDAIALMRGAAELSEPGAASEGRIRPCARRPCGRRGRNRGRHCGYERGIPPTRTLG